MGKTTIRERAFPKIIEQYNIGGKTAAYDYLRSEYGIKHPYFVIKRIKECGKYLYDADMDHFSEIDAVVRQPEPAADTRPVAMEKLVRELIRDRLLTLSRYITLDSSTRTILIDQTSLSADGYQVVTH